MEASDASEEVPPTEIAALRSSPERTVFTEEGNSDGWIATDLTVRIER